MGSEDTKILQFNQYQKSDKARFVMYEDLKFLKEKIDEYKHNTENPNTTKVSKYTPSGFSISTIL